MIHKIIGTVEAYLYNHKEDLYTMYRQNLYTMLNCMYRMDN